MFDILNLFPQYVYKDNIQRLWSDKENECMNENLDNMRQNYGNVISKNFQVLEDERMSDIKDFVEISLSKLFYDVLSVREDITPYIVSSWLNETKAGGFHHKHKHPNSYVSGVIFIKAQEDDYTAFDRPNAEVIAPTYVESNMYNGVEIQVPVVTGDILLFPSTINHGVPSVETNDSRISLAFNVMPEGFLNIEDRYCNIRNVKE